MSGKTHSVVLLAISCLACAQQSTRQTSPAPAKPAPPAPPVRQASPPINPHPSAASPPPNQQHRIIQEYPRNNERTPGGGLVQPGHFGAIQPGRPGTTAPHPSGRALSTSESAQTLGYLNAERSRLIGVNRAPLPVGTVSVRDNGDLLVSTPAHRRYEVRPNGSLSGYWHGDTTAMFRPDGSPWLIRSQNTTILRGAKGEERFTTELAGGTRVAGWGLHDGYVQRPLLGRSGNYVQRTYVMGGHQVTVVFRTFDYQGATLATYVPERQYGPKFYAWAANSWPKHIHYAWPWRNEPWAAPYRRHFDREYPDFVSWMADFIFAMTLQAQFGGSNQAAYADSVGAFYTPQENQAQGPAFNSDPANSAPDEYGALTAPLADELRREQAPPETEQPTEGNSAMAAPPVPPQPSASLPPAPPQPPTASQPPAPIQPPNAPAPAPQAAALDPENRLYYVDSLRPVVTQGLDCALTRGASLDLPAPPQAGEKNAEVTVHASNPGDCSPGTRLRVTLEELQEMNNSFRVDVYAANRTACASLARRGLSIKPWCDGQFDPQGQPNPALTADAPRVLGQEQNATRTTEQTVDSDLKSQSGASHSAP